MKYFNINGAQFKMVAVEGGTFIMGDNTYGYTAHNVTLTGFCIGETEMTELLYRRISDPEYNPTNPSKAYSSFSYSGITSKLNQLNTIENKLEEFLNYSLNWKGATPGMQINENKEIELLINLIKNQIKSLPYICKVAKEIL